MIESLDGGLRCGLCGAQAARGDIAQAARASLCRTCVEAGLTKTLRSCARVRDGETLPEAFEPCTSCGEMTPPASLFQGELGCACTTCLRESFAALVELWELRERRGAFFPYGSAQSVREAVRSHFPGRDVADLVTSARQFPAYSRADLARGLDALFADLDATCFGVKAQHDGSTVLFASVLSERSWPAMVAPLRYDDVDIGEAEPVRCLSCAVWLAELDDVPFALLLSEARNYSEREGWWLEIATPRSEAGEQLTRRLLTRLADEIDRAASYRGKILSLSLQGNCRNDAARDIAVHALAPVRRDEVILPEETLALLERNVFDFVALRPRLAELKMPVRKGLLFHGPPGTGKTHAIRYIAGRLTGHTTLLITAEQIASFSTYVTLARLLAPSIVVIEDVDLIARNREHLQTPGQETLLNRLLNEMDGLTTDAAILFVLTTNRPDVHEAALASRPGRIDQAIEFPNPDAAGRRRLVDLYRQGLDVDAPTVDTIVRKTEGVSASFIKELMRRVAQFALGRDPTTHAATGRDVELALQELLFGGGTLNARLLGAAAPSA